MLRAKGVGMTDQPLVVGIDVAARRPCTAVALQGGRIARAVEWLESDDRGGLVDWVVRLGPQVVAVDAPQGWKRAPRGTRRSRACDHELLRRGLSVYQVPSKVDVESGAANLPEWMGAGFELFRALRRRGFESPPDGSIPGALGQPAAVIEVYPYAAFATLLGQRPRAKTERLGLAARVRALRQAGVEWDDFFDHDSLDALAAALTGWRCMQGRACTVGESREGLLWLPVPCGELKETYRA
jgi:predicted nuclease with RNAse H fold